MVYVIWFTQVKLFLLYSKLYDNLKCKTVAILNNKCCNILKFEITKSFRNLSYEFKLKKKLFNIILYGKTIIYQYTKNHNGDWPGVNMK